MLRSNKVIISALQYSFTAMLPGYMIQAAKEGRFGIEDSATK